MAKIIRSKEDKAKDEQKLTAKGKSELAKAKADHNKIQNATFDVAANEIMNEDLGKLCDIPQEKPDTKLSEDQDKENKKNQAHVCISRCLFFYGNNPNPSTLYCRNMTPFIRNNTLLTALVCMSCSER